MKVNDKTRSGSQNHGAEETHSPSKLQSLNTDGRNLQVYKSNIFYVLTFFHRANSYIPLNIKYEVSTIIRS